MATIILTIIAVIAAAVAITLGVLLAKAKKSRVNVITLSDVAPVHKEKESEFMYKRRCVLKLQDDIIKSDVMAISDEKIELKVVVER